MTKIFSPIFVLILFAASAPAQNYVGKQKDIQKILQHIETFSEKVVQQDAEGIARAYADDAKIFPGNQKIISGRAPIERYWTPSPERGKIVYHKILPEEIQIVGKTAYDFGYYEGKTQQADGSEVSWRGKYVIVWHKRQGEWKIYLDIWNRVKE
jgi:ketosteroid isomerase-like protein